MSVEAGVAISIFVFFIAFASFILYSSRLRTRPWPIKLLWLRVTIATLLLAAIPFSATMILRQFIDYPPKYHCEEEKMTETDDQTVRTYTRICTLDEE